MNLHHDSLIILRLILSGIEVIEAGSTEVFFRDKLYLWQRKWMGVVRWQCINDYWKGDIFLRLEVVQGHIALKLFQRKCPTDCEMYLADIFPHQDESHRCISAPVRHCGIASDNKLRKGFIRRKSRRKFKWKPHPRAYPKLTHLLSFWFFGTNFNVASKD